ncbi:MAG: hypothetical protein FK734_04525 [Asgard group archaeon]|nr:hypothetical protein [Asgard group archaeon]
MLREDQFLLYKKSDSKHFYWWIWYEPEQQQITNCWGEFSTQGEIVHTKVSTSLNHKEIIQEKMAKKQVEGYKNLALNYIFYSTSQVIFTCHQTNQSSPTCLEFKTMIEKAMTEVASHLESSGLGLLTKESETSAVGTMSIEYYLTLRDDTLEFTFILSHLKNYHQKLLDMVAIELLTIDDKVPIYPKD